MFGGCAHSIDVMGAFGGDMQSVHAVANKGTFSEDYPIQGNFFINLLFKSGIIGRVSELRHCLPAHADDAVWDLRHKR